MLNLLTQTNYFKASESELVSNIVTGYGDKDFMTGVSV